MYEDIKQAYTGGHTDIYIPQGSNLFHYDKNSLYPSVMYSFDMPVGDIHYFEGDLSHFYEIPYGFSYVR